MASFRRLYPQAWTELSAVWAWALNEGWPAPDARDEARRVFIRTALRAAVVASDAAAAQWARVVIAEAKLVGTKDPETCWALLTASKPVQSGAWLPQDLAEREQAAETSLFADLGLPSSVPAAAHGEVEALKQRLRTALRRADRDPALVETRIADDTDHSNYCEAVEALYEAALALPSAQAGPALRYVSARMEG